MLTICNSDNYNSTADWNAVDGNLTTVGSNGRSSYYGVYDQNGNINEILGTIDGSYPMFRGGSCLDSASSLIKSYYGVSLVDSKRTDVGFRLAKNPSYSTIGEYVEVGDAGNSVDASNNNLGRVDYVYQIQKYPVTNSEYASFLNAVAKQSNTVSLWVAQMGDPIQRGGIFRSGTSSLGFTYYVVPDMENKPVNFINWFCAARYVNWLHNGRPSGAVGISTTESGVYTLLSMMVTGTNKPSASNKNSYWIPTENEWYKAAFFDPDKNGSGPGYWIYATRSDSLPDSVTSDSTGTANNTHSNPNICISPTPTPTNTPTNTLSSTPTPTPSITVSVSQTTTPTRTPTNTQTQTNTPSRSFTSTPTPTKSVTPTRSLTPRLTPSLSMTATPTRSPTPT